MKKKELRDRDMIVSTASSREELEKSILVKMKSVTGAEEGVCVAMLEENGKRNNKGCPVISLQETAARFHIEHRHSSS